MAKAVFYTGPGVFNFEDEDYGYGAELPAELPAATVESMIEKGKASYTAPAGAQIASSDNGVADLQEKLAEVTRAATRNSNEIERLQTELATARKANAEAATTITGLQTELATAQETIKTQTATIGSLTAQITTPSAPADPAAPAAGGAGPKK